MSYPTGRLPNSGVTLPIPENAIYCRDGMTIPSNSMVWADPYHPGFLRYMVIPVLPSQEDRRPLQPSAMEEIKQTNARIDHLYTMIETLVNSIGALPTAEPATSPVTPAKTPKVRVTALEERPAGLGSFAILGVLIERGQVMEGEHLPEGMAAHEIAKFIGDIRLMRRQDEVPVGEALNHRLYQMTVKGVILMVRRRAGQRIEKAYFVTPVGRKAYNETAEAMTDKAQGAGEG